MLIVNSNPFDSLFHPFSLTYGLTFVAFISAHPLEGLNHTLHACNVWANI